MSTTFNFPISFRYYYDYFYVIFIGISTRRMDYRHRWLRLRWWQRNENGARSVSASQAESKRSEEQELKKKKKKKNLSDTSCLPSTKRLRWLLTERRAAKYLRIRAENTYSDLQHISVSIYSCSFSVRIRPIIKWILSERAMGARYAMYARVHSNMHIMCVDAHSQTAICTRRKKRGKITKATKKYVHFSAWVFKRGMIWFSRVVYTNENCI